MGEDVHDAAHWDRRYAESAEQPLTEPEPAVVDLVARIPSGGRALDVATGEGRHAIWLAGLGWDVTAIDFSRTGVETGRRMAAEVGVEVRWLVGDVADHRERTAYDLIVCCFVRLEPPVMAQVREGLSPGGHLVLVAHGRGPGGPTDPRYRSTAGSLQERAGDLDVLVSDTVTHVGADGRERERVRALAQRPRLAP